MLLEQAGAASVRDLVEAGALDALVRVRVRQALGCRSGAPERSIGVALGRFL